MQRGAPDPLGLLEPAHAQPQRRQREEVLDVVVVDAAQPVHGLGQRREREAAERDTDQHRPKIEGARDADNEGGVNVDPQRGNVDERQLGRDRP